MERAEEVRRILHSDLLGGKECISRTLLDLSTDERLNYLRTSRRLPQSPILIDTQDKLCKTPEFKSTWSRTMANL